MAASPPKSRFHESHDDFKAALAHLRSRDPVLGGLIDRVPPYEIRAERNLFEVMLRTIVSQQLSGKAADSIYARLSAAMGKGPAQPAQILSLLQSRRCWIEYPVGHL